MHKSRKRINLYEISLISNRYMSSFYYMNKLMIYIIPRCLFENNMQITFK